MSRQTNVSWSTICLVFFFGMFVFLPMSLASAKDIKKSASLPVYISTPFEVYGYSSYTVTGALSNKTGEDVLIDVLEIALTGTTGKTHYYAESNQTLTNIIVPANSTYQIHIDNIVYSKSGYGEAKGELENATLSKCVINGEEVDLVTQEDMEMKGVVYGIVIGSIGLIGTVSIIVYKIYKKITLYS